MPTVDSVMTRCPIGVRADTPLRTVAAVLFRNAVSAVPVLDGRGFPIGVVSEIDIVRAGSRAGLAGDVMSLPVVTVAADESLSTAARRLSAVGVRRLFVVEDRRLVGVVARRDLLAGYVRADDEIHAQVEQDVRAVLADGNECVNVTVRDGVVLLLGRVGWRDELARVSEVAAAVPGVVAVRNRMGFLWAPMPRGRLFARSAR